MAIHFFLCFTSTCRYQLLSPMAKLSSWLPIVPGTNKLLRTDCSSFNPLRVLVRLTSHTQVLNNSHAFATGLFYPLSNVHYPVPPGFRLADLTGARYTVYVQDSFFEFSKTPLKVLLSTEHSLFQAAFKKKTFLSLGPCIFEV